MRGFAATQGEDPQSLGEHIEFGPDQAVGPLWGRTHARTQQTNDPASIGATQEDDLGGRCRLGFSPGRDLAARQTAMGAEEGRVTTALVAGGRGGGSVARPWPATGR